MMRNWLCALVIASAACGGGSVRAPRPPISKETRAVKLTDWTKGSSDEIQWPTSVARRQLVITTGWAPDEHLAWYIADGTRAVALFRTANQVELAEAITKFTDEVKAGGQSGIVDKRGWVIIGGIVNPPPPPPWPGGMPPNPYLEFVMNVAWENDLNVVTTKIEGGQIKQQMKQ